MALAFNGATDTAENLAGTKLGQTTGTFFVWAMPVANRSNNVVFISEGVTNDYFCLFFSTTTYFGWLTGAVDTRVHPTGLPWTNNVWVNLSCTWVAGGVLQSYVNGIVNAFTAPGVVTNSTTAYQIGNALQRGLNWPWNGSIADMCFWNVVLSQAEITALAKGVLRPAQIRPANITAYYPLDGVSVVDLSVYRKTLKLKGGVLAAQPPLLARRAPMFNQQTTTFMPPTFVWGKPSAGGVSPRYYYDMNRSQHV